MRGLRLIPAGTNLPFIPLRKVFFAFSLVLVLGSLALFAVKGMNFGIDFKGGILMEVQTKAARADIAALRGELGALGLGDVSLQRFGADNEVLIRIQRQEGGAEAQQAAVDTVKNALGERVGEYRRVEFVGPKISEELMMDGIYAVSFALGAILIYIALRFEWQFGLGAIVALVHDIATTIGVFSLTGIEFNLSTIAAVLTIAGYSINDTVVIYDRVRENLRRYKTLELPQLLNQSVNETLARTAMTSLTTLIALGSLYILGGEVIRGFSFAMIWGVIIGTYSSVCVAVPLLLYLNLRRGGEEDEEALEQQEGGSEAGAS